MPLAYEQKTLTSLMPYFTVKGECSMNSEQKRLEEDRRGLAAWKKWGPYLSERQWGTVREDYSAEGDAWNYFTHDHARSRAYRWEKTAWPAFPTTNSGFVLPWPCGTETTPS